MKRILSFGTLLIVFTLLVSCDWLPIPPEWFGAGDGHSLDAADGNPKDVVYVDNQGNVGIGTTNPEARLDIDGYVVIGGEGEADILDRYGQRRISLVNRGVKNLSLRRADGTSILVIDENGDVLIKGNVDIVPGMAGHENLKVRGEIEVNGGISTGHGGLRWKLFEGTTGSRRVNFSHGLDASKIYSISCVLRNGVNGPGYCQEFGLSSIEAGEFEFYVMFDASDVVIADIEDSLDDADDTYKCIVWYVN